jgi:hypothetical protein
MRTSRWAALAGAAVLAASLAACSDSSTDSPDMSRGALGVYYSDAPATVTQLRIRFTEFALYDTNGDKVTLTVTSGAPVDLIAAKDDPQYLATWNLPVGDYNGLEGKFEVVDFKEAGHPDFVCLPPSNLQNVTIPKITLPNAFVRVTDTTTYNIVVDVPVVSGECLGNGLPGTLAFGNVTVAPHVP